ncbi:hypothetical protein [uncultured Dubosiella sp.]|uniref:hypothetical protein n=1 Tax=uncultured Dubosiella sp. TaxID=1937011 RepID=UPI00261D6C8E|nr:hypothetical protein [uncultured Dubosiella sp.]
MNRVFVYIRNIEEKEWSIISIDIDMPVKTFLNEWMKGDFGLGIYDVELERVLNSTFRMVAHGDHLVIF